MEQQTILDTLKIEISEIELGIKNKFNSNLNSNLSNTLKEEYPPAYRQINSQKYYMNQKTAELRNKIHETNEPRDELNLF